MRTTQTQLSDHPIELADILVGAWKTGVSFKGLSAGTLPIDAEGAYATQHQIVALRGGTIAGWKVGAKSDAGPAQAAPLPESGVHFTPAWLPCEANRKIGLELEIAFSFGRTFSPRCVPYQEEEVLGAIECMAPAIEVVRSRFLEWPQVDKFAQLADLQNHGALVVGDFVDYRPDFPFLDASVLFAFNDTDIVRGKPENPAGDPRRLLPWLVNHVTARGLTLEPGAIVTTGSYTGMHFPEGPGVALGRFAGLPPVELNLE